MIVEITIVVVGIPLFSILVLLLSSIIRKRRYPDKTFKNCLINNALMPLRILQLGPYKNGEITIDNAIKYALKKTKLQDLGSADFAKAYRRLTDTPIHKDQKFSNLGYISARMEMNLSVARRIRLVEFFKKFPKVLEIPVRSPVFVLGLPRTGTTFLHRLLSLDPAVRAPLLWELLDSCPDIRCAGVESDLAADREKRAKRVRRLIQTRKSMGDKALEHIHEIDADLPEECLLALSDEIPILMQFLYTAYMNMEVWFDVVDSDSVIRAYKWYRQVLQLLSYQMGAQEANNPRRWLLKCPMHMLYQKEIAAAFPDAKLIWTHRHPVSAVPSMCSLVKSFHSVYFEKDSRDDAALGREVSKVTAKMLAETPTNMEACKLDYANVMYHELVSDPLNTVKNLYQQFGWAFTEEYENILTQHLIKDSEKRKEVTKKRATKELHTYSPEEFHLTTEQLSTGVFGDYVAMYNLPMSKN